jgi:hypothetical protein
MKSNEFTWEGAEMLRLSIKLAIILALLCSCSTYRDTSRQRLETLPYHYSQFDLQLAWEIKPVGSNATLVDGAVKNVRYVYMYDLEIWVAVLDDRGKSVARSVSYIIPRQLNIDESAPFTLKLPVAAAPGTKLRFTYQYRGSDGGDERRRGDGGGTRWMQSFKTEVPAR